MAITKIWRVAARLDSSVKYIINPDKTGMNLDMDAVEKVEKYIVDNDKTENALYVRSYNCGTDKACERMIATQKKFGKDNRKNGVLAYHLVQSFKDFETTPEIAHKCGLELAERLLSDKYEVVVATHLDHAHLHNHIIFNSVSFVDGKKYRNNFKDYFRDIRGISDQICRENCLSVIEHPKHRGMHYAEWAAEKKGLSIRQQVREELDEIIKSSYTMKEFWKILNERGYDVKRQSDKYKFTSFVPPFGKKRIRLDKLGAQYTEAAIQERITTARNGIRTASPTELYNNGFDFERNYKHLNPVKLKGFIALYYHYLYLFGKVKRKQTPQRVSFFMREELSKFERYQKQFKFLYEHNIETVGDLTEYHSKTEEKISDITAMKKELYATRTEDNKEEIKEQAQIFNNTLRKLRGELRLCKSIYSDAQTISSRHSQAEAMQKQSEMEVMQNEHKRRGR